MNRLSRLAVLGTLGVAAFGLSGCSFSVYVDSEALADRVQSTLEQQTGNQAKNVDCPEDLTGEVGETTRCTLTAMDDSQIGVDVEVTSVEDGQVNFDIQVDETPMR
ncbi:hypothetical protein BJF85_14290 [Saccharomonospora sp. CUA-673]|uniref:DUF4333 domain-containing protein n=1 Tax=Saccharomonospora sp. CUA-673 TaxID=1904969 RepID=UPI000969C88F|nr:DUF4333 domain-containing protein [Saccharomonospora sp. CUA-673]OLT47810.1 hypothetical protein BJF85_14290 [Saccharomonospora sp. CUA-673]